MILAACLLERLEPNLPGLRPHLQAAEPQPLDLSRATEAQVGRVDTHDRYHKTGSHTHSSVAFR